MRLSCQSQLLDHFVAPQHNWLCKTLLQACMYYLTNMYHSLTKKRPPTFGPISCLGSKFTQKCTHHGVSFMSVLDCNCEVGEAQPEALCISEVRKFMLYFTEGNYKAALHRWMLLMRHALWVIPYLQRYGAVQSIVCHQYLTLKSLVVPLYGIVQSFALRALSHFKHDMGILSRLNAETL